MVERGSVAGLDGCIIVYSATQPIPGIVFVSDDGNQSLVAYLIYAGSIRASRRVRRGMRSSAFRSPAASRHDLLGCDRMGSRRLSR